MQLDALNAAAVTDELWIAGQLSESDITALAGAGVKTIVNLRPDAEMTFDERSLVEAAGMTYVSIPVAGAAGVTVENADRLSAVLAKSGATMVHCASANRVGGLFAIASFKGGGVSVDEAVEYGRARGLTKLEPLIRQILAGLA